MVFSCRSYRFIHPNGGAKEKDMNSLANKGIVFTFWIVLVVVLSACDTLKIDKEPAASSIEPAVTATVIVQPTPTQANEETEVSTVAVEATVVAITTPVNREEKITPEVMAEATTDLLTYENHEYGFSLMYPPTWTAAEVNDEDFLGPGSRSVQLSQGTATLVIGYRRAGEDMMMMGSGAPAGEFEIRGTVQVVGQHVDRYVIAFEGKDKVVFYGQPGALVSAGGLEFAPRMDDFAQLDYGEIELSQSFQNEADLILSSLAIIEVE